MHMGSPIQGRPADYLVTIRKPLTPSVYHGASTELGDTSQTMSHSIPEVLECSLAQHRAC